MSYTSFLCFFPVFGFNVRKIHDYFMFKKFHFEFKKIPELRFHNIPFENW